MFIVLMEGKHITYAMLFLLLGQEITYTRFFDLDPEKDLLIMYNEGNWRSIGLCCAPLLCETGKLIE